MNLELEQLERQASRARNYESPPLQRWNPALSGDMPIHILTDGTWCHDGTVIRRASLVRLFASILRREADGDYYLVTPVEKWRITVDLHPLLVTDVSLVDGAVEPVLKATLNTDKIETIDAEHGLCLDPTVGDIPVLQLDHGLTALLSRPAWYRLAEMATQHDGMACICSAGLIFPLVRD